jgi:tetratricopeptide (TPR) repeat protein
LGRLEEAKAQLERAKVLNPESDDARYQLAAVLRRLKETEQAKAELRSLKEKLAGRQETAAGATGSEANKLLEEGNPQEAARLYRGPCGSIRTMPKPITIWRWR